jgi:hypothetical protein
MNGYLQRLVSRAMNSAESIHPVLGSVFSAPKYASEREGSPMEGDGLSSIQTESPKPAESAHPVSGAVFSAPKSARQREGFSMEVDKLPRRRPESLVTPVPASSRPFHDPRPWPEPLVPSERLPTPPGERTPEAPQTQPEIAESNRESGRHREKREQEGTSQSRYEPLIAESLIRPNNQQILRRESFASGAREKDDLSGRPIPTEGEPDEIQIHIGRIEVTAVSQTGARAATKPARKGLNLEEYLKRRDGRA